MWSPKTKAAWIFMNVVIWRKKYIWDTYSTYCSALVLEMMPHDLKVSAEFFEKNPCRIYGWKKMASWLMCNTFIKTSIYLAYGLFTWSGTKNSRKFCEIFAKYSRKICEKFVKNSWKICKKFAKNLRKIKIHTKFAKNSWKIREFWANFDFSQIFCKFFTNFSQIFRKYFANISRIFREFFVPDHVKSL